MLSMIGAVVVAATLSGHATAEQYKWTDRDGKVQYGDTPPAGVQATLIKGPAASAPTARDANPRPLSPAEQEAEFRKRRLEAEKAFAKDDKAAQDAEASRENCKNAQDYQRQLEGGQRISRTDAKGERVFMEDDQRALEMTKARKMIADWCK
jgi:hypothetical protein